MESSGSSTLTCKRRASARDVLASVVREEIALQGSIEMEARGSSMEPTVPGGSTLRIEPLHGVPAVGELVAFVSERGALLYCHRVIAVDEGTGQVTTQGDRHSQPDGLARLDQIVGIVRSFSLGGRIYSVSPDMPRPRPSAYRVQRQRLVRLMHRLRAS
jgi:hypothetical protein